MKQSKIETRILSIVDPTNRRRGIARIQGISVVALGIVAVFVGAALSPTLALAQDKAKDTKPPIEVPIKVQTVERVQGVEVREIPVQRAALVEVRADQVRQGKAAKHAKRGANRKAAKALRVRRVSGVQLREEKVRLDKGHRLGQRVTKVKVQRAHESRVGAEHRFRSEYGVSERLVEGKAIAREQLKKAEVDVIKATQVRERVKVLGHLTKVEDVTVQGRQTGVDHVNGRLGAVTFEAKAIDLQAAPKAKAEVALQLRSENVRVTTEVKPETRHELVIRAVQSGRGELAVRSVPIKLEISKTAAGRQLPIRNGKAKGVVRVDTKVQGSMTKKKAIDDEKAAADKARRKQQALDDLEINRQKYNL